MDYSDWLTIISSMVVITFLTLFGLAVLERDLKKNTLLLWVSVGGLIVSIIITGTIIWYYHKKEINDSNKGMNKKSGDNKEMDKKSGADKEINDGTRGMDNKQGTNNEMVR